MSAPAPAETSSLVTSVTAGASNPKSVQFADASIDIGQQRQRTWRSPMALGLSTAMHVLLLMALALVGLTSQEPKDQIALTASAAEPVMNNAVVHDRVDRTGRTNRDQ